MNTNTTSKPLNSVCLLGPDIDHRLSLEAALNTVGIKTQWIPDFNSFSRTRGDKPRPVWRRVMDACFGTQDQEYRELLSRNIYESAATVVIGYWGTIPLFDLAAIRQVRPEVKLSLMLLCYPLALTRVGVFKQHLLLRRALKYLDGILCPSQDMIDYLRMRLPLTHARFGILAPCWPARFQDSVSRSEPSPQVNLVYIGRTDLSHPTIHAADDSRVLMQSVLNAGIELHHAYSPETDDGHPLRKSFAPVKNDELSNFIGTFDASLIAYNTSACECADRFELTVPDRLISSVTAGIPIAIPRQGYSASKAYLGHYPAVIEFDNAEELHRTLSNRLAMAKLRQIAWDSRCYYTAEQQAVDLGSFLGTL